MRLWVTLYYGFCLFGSVFGQQIQPTFEVPPTVFWRGNAITFYKYRNDGSCLNLATNSSVTNGYAGMDEQNGWFGGLDRFTVKMDSSLCIKVPTRKLGNPGNTWIRFQFDQGYNGCSTGYNSGSQYNIHFFTDSECRMGQQSSTVNFWDAGGAMLPRDGECFYDRGGASNPPQGQIYYRAFCDVVLPNITTTHVYPTTVISNNHTTYVSNNHTTYVPTIVKPEDVMAMLQTLMVRNATFFKSLKTLDVSSTPPPPPPILAASSVTKQQSGSGTLVSDVALILVATAIAYL